ncbi:MAG: SGNH/GDSL hydrolase family protein [Clostridia bacterium]|nr:SGNH/GDSL hydrolase family protein [Clostridia bacterium]
MNVKEYITVGEKEKPLDRIVTDGGFCGIFRKIACIGDSLSSGEFESIKEDGTKRYHDFFEYSWGQYIARSTGATVYNFSRGGMTAKEYVESFADNMGYWDRNKACQAYIIALGVNDITCNVNGQLSLGDLSDVDVNDYHSNKKTFIGYYAKIIHRIKEIQPRAKIFLVSPLRHGDKVDEKREYVRDLLKGLSEMYSNTYLLDMFTYAPVQNAEYNTVLCLGGHLTPMGYIVSARMIESYIDYIIRKNPDDFKQVAFIGTDLYYQDEED